jgi:DNA-binding response OmpR family regulator
MSTNEPQMSILFLEPEILIRMVVAQYLRDCGYIVIEGVEADDFRSLIDSGKQPHIVLIDVHLRGQTNGFELSRTIRQTHPDIDVILTSGIAGAADEAQDLCDEGPIKKPYHPKDVEARIRILLERRRRANRT